MRAALRSLRHAPGFSLLVICTLGVALGANIALFSAADALLFRALPYHQSDRLVTLFEIQPGSGARALVSVPNFLDWKSSPTMSIAAYRPWGFVLTGMGDAERLTGARVSADLLPVLGVNPVIGRGFRPDEDMHGGPAVVLVSHGFWHRRLAASAELRGQRLVLNGVTHQVVGVLPSDFNLPAADVLVPLAVEPFALAQRGNRALTVIGRLADGVTIDRARADIASLARAIASRSPATAGWDAGVVSLAEHVIGRFRPTLLMVWAVVAIVLLIACANTTGLMLVRTAARREELAVYAALGAARAWIARRLVTESLVLGIAAGVLGLALARLFLSMLAAAAPPELSRLADAAIDVRAAGFALALSMAAGTLAGILPAASSGRDDLSPALRAARAIGAPHRGLGRAALAGQVGLAMTVLLGAGLMVRSFERVMAVSPGFDPARVLSLSVSPDARYADPRRRVAFFDALLTRISAVPGVEAAGIISHPPLAAPPLTADVTGPSRALATYSVVGGDWFRAMGVPMRRGRAFGPADRMGTRPVVIVSENFARAMWPDNDPIGQSIVVGGTIGADPAPREIVGIASEVRTSLEADAPFHVYAPYAQNPWPTMGVAVRTAGNPAALIAPVRAAVASLDRDQAVYSARPFDAVVGRAVASRRFQALIVSLFALLAIALAATGVYTVVAYTVRLRTPEIGVRLALGASRWSVVGLALRDALTWAICGLLAGLSVAVAAGHAVEGMLFGVRPTDAGTAVVTVVLMTGLVTSASLLAAWGAARVDPLAALRGR